MKNLSLAVSIALPVFLAACDSSSSTSSPDDVSIIDGSTTAGSNNVPTMTNPNTGDGNGNTNTGGDNTEGDNTGADNTEGDNTGADNTEGDNTGGDNTEGDNTGGNNTEGDNTDVANGGTGTTTPTETNNGSDISNNIPPTADALLSAGLSHAGTTIASVPAILNDPQILTSGQNRVASLPNNPAVMFEVVSNQGTSTGLNCSALGAQFNSCNIVNLHMKDSNGDLNDNDWKLYFHSTRRVLQVTSDEFDVTHVNGDLHYLAPNAQFSGFAGGVKSAKLVTEFNYLVETDFQPRYWIARGGDAALITNTDDETDESRYAMDITGNNRFEFVGETNQIASSTNRFTRNANIINSTSTVANTDVAARIVPQPSSVVVGAGTLDIGSGFSFANFDLPSASISALQARQAQFMSTGAGVTMQSSIDAGMAANTYTISVSAAGITVNASDEAMLFYAAQSLLALVQPGVGSIPFIEITDSPRFNFRGMHIDVARNFHSVESVKKLLDQMGAYKLNTLHMHLADDEGWRLEIPSLPELTSVGGTRAFNVDANGLVTETASLMPAMGSGPNSNNQGSGFYTQAQFIDLLQYANARFVEVIPEFDMPGHARAAVVAMRARASNLGNANDINVRLDDPNDTTNFVTIQNYTDNFINPCVPGTQNFIQALVNDVRAMYTSAGLPLDIWHMGGDEAISILRNLGAADEPWSGSPVCAQFIANTAGVNSVADLESHFVSQVAQVVADAGITTLYAFQDIYSDLNASDLATVNAGVDHWVPLSSTNPTNAANNIASANDFNARGFNTVIGAPDYLYFDFPYEVDPKERGYYWATRSTSTEKLFRFAPENQAQNAETSVARDGSPWSATNTGNYTGFEGIQGFLWSETVRTPQQFDYMLFPRVLALAERAWHEASWELPYVEGASFSATSGNVDTAELNNDFATFALALANKELPKLDAAGISYRIPPPGAQLQGGVLQMNSNYPGLPLEFSTDGSAWQTWNATSPPSAASFVRSLSANGLRSGRATPIE